MADDLGRMVAFLQEIDERSAQRRVPFPDGVALLHDELPQVWDFNYLRLERAAPADRVAAEADRILGGAGRDHRKVHVDDAALGARLAPDFAALGWETITHVVMPHRRPPERAGAPDTVREVDAESLREAWEAGIRDEPWGRNEDVVRQLVERRAVTADAVRTRYFAAFAGNEVASYCELYSEGGTGQIEAVATLEPYRNRGLASAVVLRALEESRAAGDTLTFLLADEDDWPKELYQRLGFDRVGRLYRFLRKPG